MRPLAGKEFALTSRGGEKMKKKIMLGFIFCFVFVSAWVSPVKGEDYRSKTFPPAEILIKNAGRCNEFVGKMQGLAESEYFVYLRCPDGSFEMMQLFKLDTDVWVVRIIMPGGKPLQK